MSEDIAMLKQMFTATSTNKYTGPLHQDIKKWVPKFATAYKNLEKAITDDPDSHDWSKTAGVLHKNQKVYLDLKEWYYKLCGKSKGSTKVKREPL